MFKIDGGVQARIPAMCFGKKCANGGIKLLVVSFISWRKGREKEKKSEAVKVSQEGR